MLVNATHIIILFYCLATGKNGVKTEQSHFGNSVMTVINNSQVNNSDNNNGASTNTHYVGRLSNNIKLPKPLG